MTPLAAQADTTVIAAFAVGFISFISPCVLPLVPGYLSAVSGVSVTDIREGRHRLSHVLGPAIVFCLSFTLMFVALGMTATGLGSTLRDSKATLDKVAGILAKPQDSGFSLAVWWVPVAVVLGLVALVAALLPRWRRRPPGDGPPRAPALSAADERRLDEDLARYDV